MIQHQARSGLTKTGNRWEIGQRVKVGFLRMTVTAKEPTPGDYAPDAYLLKSDKGVNYRFVPHKGLERV